MARLLAEIRGRRKGLGLYDLTDENSTYIYGSQDDLFTDDEVTRYENGDADTLRAINQKVAFIRDGEKIRFTTVSDDLGTLKIKLILNGQEVGSIEREMTAEEDFRRVIAAVEGMVAGDDPPTIKAWEDYPLGGIFFPPTPPLGQAEQDQLMNASPGDAVAQLNAALGADPNLTLSDPGLFYWFVTLVVEEPVYAPSSNPELWTESKRDSFFALLTSWGYDYSGGGTATTAAAGGGAPAAMAAPAGGVRAGYRGTPTTRNEIQLPAEIRNRGLVAKTLLWLINRTIKGQIAYSEGAVFGMWDGIKGDVEGVIDTLRMPVTVFNALKDPYKTAGEIYETFKAVRDMGWDGVKNSVKAMIGEFIGDQKERMALALPAEVEDPGFMTAYLGGYVSGCIGEQVVAGVLTAGAAKIGWVGKALRMGAQAAQKTLTTVGEAGAKVQKIARGFTAEFGRCARSADELRATRRSGSLCRSPIGCLAAGTLVAMEGGAFKPIEQIHTGDRVLAGDPDRPLTVSVQTVSSQVFNTAPSVINISWDEDHNGTIDGTVAATSAHPFYVPGIGWQPASKLQRGMPLRTMSGASAEIVATSRSSTATATYNLDVDGPNTFFVASSAGSALLVHNAEGDVYPYDDPIPGRPVGQSQEWLKVGETYVPQFENGLPKMIENQQHHFFWNAWLNNNFADQGYIDYQRGVPCVELSNLQHKQAHAAGHEWFRNNPKFGRMPRGAEWKNVSLPEMEELSAFMANRIGLPEIKINTLKNLSGGYLRAHYKLVGCSH